MSRELFVQRGKSPEIIKLLLEDGDRLITETEVARMTGLSRRTLQHHRYAGKYLSYFKLKSGAVRYLLSDVCADISESSVPE